jgi:hypothetical protein
VKAPSDLPDALLAPRGLARYPALVLVLDSMDIRTPAGYAQVLRAFNDDHLHPGPARRRAAVDRDLLDRQRGRRALVLFTDGEESNR